MNGPRDFTMCATDFFQSMLVHLFKASRDHAWRGEFTGFKDFEGWLELYMRYLRVSRPPMCISINPEKPEQLRKDCCRPRIGDTVWNKDTQEPLGTIKGHAIAAKTGSDKLYSRFEVERPDGTTVYLYENDGVFRAISLEES